jgi:ubiquinone/menaquinone biosynthesis C-methylase UbiE
MSHQKYVPALSFRWLTPLYDALVEGPMSFARMRRDLLTQMGNLGNKKVLDVGCGTGTMLVIVKRAFPTSEVVGLDGDLEILEMARAKAQKSAPGIQFDHGMSFDLPYPDESFDVVLTSMMLHHLIREDKEKTAREMYRVLRPGGQLFGADFAAPRGALGNALRPLTRRFERVADNVDGFLPVLFHEAGFKDYAETGRYFLGSIAVFQGSKS